MSLIVLAPLKKCFSFASTFKYVWTKVICAGKLKLFNRFQVLRFVFCAPYNRTRGDSSLEPLQSFYQTFFFRHNIVSLLISGERMTQMLVPIFQWIVHHEACHRAPWSMPSIKKDPVSTQAKKVRFQPAATFAHSVILICILGFQFELEHLFSL